MAICVIGLLVYHNSFGNSFHYDDSHSLVDNSHVRSLGNILRFFYDPGTFSAIRKAARLEPGQSESYLNIGRVSLSLGRAVEALAALEELCETEGILTALETAHAYASAKEWAKNNPGKRILIGNSGRGDKDMPTLTQFPPRTNVNAGT